MYEGRMCVGDIPSLDQMCGWDSLRQAFGFQSTLLEFKVIYLNLFKIYTISKEKSAYEKC